MRVILDAMETLDVPLANSGNAKRAEIILSLPPQIDADALPRHVVDAVHGLWMDEGVQHCFSRSREYQLNDSAK
jgi:guanine nucleotide-binding protein G(i) subunit alpha